MASVLTVTACKSCSMQDFINIVFEWKISIKYITAYMGVIKNMLVNQCEVILLPFCKSIYHVSSKFRDIFD